MTDQEVTKLTCKKHVKIYKLNQLGFKNSEIAKMLGTNPGHVYNALKKYKNDPSLCEKANFIRAS